MDVFLNRVTGCREPILLNYGVVGMKVVKIGGGCLKDAATIKHIMELVTVRGEGNVFVVSALYGVTNIIIDGIEKALADESLILPHLENIIHTPQYCILEKREKHTEERKKNKITFQAQII